MTGDESGNALSSVEWSITDASNTYVIDSTSGASSLAPDASLDYEDTPSYTVSVEATGSKGGETLTATLTLTIEVVDLLETLTVMDMNSTDNTILTSASLSDAVEGLELSVASESATLENASVTWSSTDTNGYFAIDVNGVVTPAQSLVNVPAGEYEAVITASRDNGGSEPETINGTLTVTITIEAAAYTIAGNEQASYDLSLIHI